MRSRRNVLIFGAAVIVVLVLTTLARQIVAGRDVVDENNIIAQEDYRLNDTHSGDLVVFGSNINLAETSHVTGSAAFVGDTVRASGQIGGDLTAVGSTLLIDPSAHIAGQASLVGKNITLGGQIDGDLYVSGETLTILPDTQINGTLNACFQSIKDGRANPGDLSCNHENFAPFTALIALRNSAVRDTAGAMIQLSPVSALVLAVFGTVLLAGASMLAVTLFPRQISHIEEALRARPRGFGGVGIAVYVLGIGLFLVLIFALAVVPPLGLLLIPLFLIVGLLLGILSLAGLITLALMLGDRVLRRRSARMGTPPLIAALVGSVIISVLLAGIALLPFGFVLSFLALNVLNVGGLGAALFTRAGTRPLRRSYFVTG